MSMIQATFRIVTAMLDTGRSLDTEGNANLTRYGTKMYYHGGGWWRVNGNKNSMAHKKTMAHVRVKVRNAKYIIAVSRLYK